MTKKTIISILVVLILAVAIFFRLWQITKFPPSLNWDEVSLGYNAYSILKTGRDEWGIQFPLIFRAYGDYKLPLYVYFSVPFVAALGLNPLSIKLLSVVAGIVSCYLFYLICKKTFPQNPTLSIIGMLIFSLSPWSIFLSRIALEANLFLALFLISIYFLLNNQLWQSSLFYGLCLFAYNSSRVILPFYLFVLLILIFKNRSREFKNWYKYIFLIICTIIFLIQSFDVSGQARYKWVSLLDSGAINQINELRQKYPRFIINKYSYFAYHATTNYLAHFHPDFIFKNGGSNYQFNIPHFPLISPLLFPLFILGSTTLIIGLFKKPSQNQLMIVYFLLVAPIPSAITRDAPQTLRSITFVPFVIVIILYGLNWLNRHRNIYISALLFSLVAVGLTLISFAQTLPVYSRQYASSWQTGYPPMVQYLHQNYQKYDEIVITKKYAEPHEFILFYWPWSPEKYQSDLQKKWDYHADWYWVDHFDKFTFVNDWEIAKYIPTNGKQTLLITSPNSYNESVFTLIDSIKPQYQDKVFDIATNKK